MPILRGRAGASKDEFLKLPYTIHAESTRHGPRTGRHRQLSPEGPLARGGDSSLVTRGWVSPPWPAQLDDDDSPFPFDLVLELYKPCRLREVHLVASEHMRPTRVEVIAGLARPDAPFPFARRDRSPGRSDSPFRKHRLRVVNLGEAVFNPDDGFELIPAVRRKIACDIEHCVFLKIRVYGCHTGAKNPQRQASFDGITLVGVPMQGTAAAVGSPSNVSLEMKPERVSRSPVRGRPVAKRNPLFGAIGAIGGLAKGIASLPFKMAGGIGNAVEHSVRGAMDSMPWKHGKNSEQIPKTYDEARATTYVPKRAWELTNELRMAAGADSPLSASASAAAADMEKALRHERALLLTRKDKPVLDANDQLARYALPSKPRPGSGDIAAGVPPPFTRTASARAERMGQSASPADAARAPSPERYTRPSERMNAYTDSTTLSKIAVARSTSPRQIDSRVKNAIAARSPTRSRPSTAASRARSPPGGRYASPQRSGAAPVASSSALPRSPDQMRVAASPGGWGTQLLNKDQRRQPSPRRRINF